MKHLRIFEDFEDEDFEGFYTTFINWDLIADVKDMALEYIDNNMLLRITVCDKNIFIYINTFTHTTDTKKWNPLNTTIECIDDLGSVDISYVIYLRNWVSDDDRSINEESSNELISRLQEAYPEEKIYSDR